MAVLDYILYLIFLSNFLSCVIGLEDDTEPGSVPVRIIKLGLTFGFIATAYHMVTTNYPGLNILENEHCFEPWVKFNSNGLYVDLEEKVFGQHLAKDVVMKAVSIHMMNEHPSKALVMSFQGCSGCGKNYISALIAKNVFEKGYRSIYFHLYLEVNLNHPEKINQYKEKLVADIEKATLSCDRNIFVFDEVDKMVPGVLDALSPYIDSSKSGVNYHKNIFIFLSNAGFFNINNAVLALRENKKDRESITMEDINLPNIQHALNEVGGLKDSDILKRNLIDVYVPFLPMEMKHVRQCIESELKARGKAPIRLVMDEIADQLVFTPKETKMFSVSGCKKIASKVDIFAG